jgi:hypothetical protein
LGISIDENCITHKIKLELEIENRNVKEIPKGGINMKLKKIRHISLYAEPSGKAIIEKGGEI